MQLFRGQVQVVCHVCGRPEPDADGQYVKSGAFDLGQGTSNPYQQHRLNSAF